MFGFVIGQLFFARLVNVFECLKWEDGGADFACLAIPYEFNFALILEKKKAIFLGQRFSSVDQLYQIALFSVGEFVFFGVVLASPENLIT